MPSDTTGVLNPAPTGVLNPGTHLGLRELEAVCGGDDHRAVRGRNDAAVAQLGERGQRHTCGGDERIHG